MLARNFLSPDVLSTNTDRDTKPPGLNQGDSRILGAGFNGRLPLLFLWTNSLVASNR